MMTEKFLQMLREMVDLAAPAVHAGTSSRECSPGTDSSVKKKRRRLPSRSRDE